MLTFHLPKGLARIEEEIDALAEQFGSEVSLTNDAAQSFDKAQWEAFGNLKLQGLLVPEVLGGKGLSSSDLMLVLEYLGYRCSDNGLSFALGAHLLAGVIPLYLYGSQKQQEALLPQLCNGTAIMTNAISELSGGSDVFKMSAVATKNQDRYTLSGEKAYCTNAPHSAYALSYVMTDPQKGMFGGVTAFILDRSKNQYTPKATIPKMGLRSCPMSHIVLGPEKVDKTQILGQEGGGAVIFNKAMVWERIGLSAIHLGTLQRLLRDCIAYVRNRKSGSNSLSKYQAISHKIADLKVELECTRQLMLSAIVNLDSNKTPDLLASMIKLKTSELYKRATLEILQLNGAAGYTGNSEIERMHRDAIASTLYSGSTEIQKNIIAKRLGL